MDANLILIWTYLLDLNNEVSVFLKVGLVIFTNVHLHENVNYVAFVIAIAQGYVNHLSSDKRWSTLHMYSKRSVGKMEDKNWQQKTPECKVKIMQ